MMHDERVNRPLGRIAELLVENEARVGLDEIRDLLEALDDEAYAAGFQDGLAGSDDRDNEAAERAYALRFGDGGCGRYVDR